MIITHIPSGLFPHMESRFQRRPYYVLPREKVTIGLRIEEVVGELNVNMNWQVSKEAMEQKISPSQVNFEKDVVYVTFEMIIPEKLTAVKYYFTGQDEQEKITSKIYEFDIVQWQKCQFDHITKSNLEWFVALTTGSRTHWLSFQIRDKWIEFELKNNRQESEQYQNVNEGDTLNLSNSYKIEYRQGQGIKIYRQRESIAFYPLELEVLTNRRGDIYQIKQHLRIKAKAIWGLGEKFDAVNQIGKAPLAHVVEHYTNQQEKTYLPIPFFYSDNYFGYLHKGTCSVRFDFSLPSENGWLPIEIISDTVNSDEMMRAVLLMGDSQANIRSYVELTGRQVLPPKWAFGPWMSANGWDSQAEAEQQIEFMNQLAIPATVMVLEAWSDEQSFYIFNQANYDDKEQGVPYCYDDFRFEAQSKWPNPKAFSEKIALNKLKLVLWQIPVIKHQFGEIGRQLQADQKYAITNGLCVEHLDGSPYRIPELWFKGSLLPDFTNPETNRWWFEKRRYLLEELNVAGFKTDGGEFLFDDQVILHDGRQGKEAHNAYPMEYLAAYHRFMSQVMGEEKGITFSRAGYTGAQQYPIHWAGDQVSTFSELEGQLKAGLSLGLSGVPFWGFDIGGFAGDFPTTELYLRATAMAVFSPIMQFHSEPRYGQFYMTEREHWNNDRSPWNLAAANKDTRIIEYYRLFANLRMNLLPYIWREARQTVTSTRPLMAHLAYDYYTDKQATGVEDEYLFGRSLLVAPIVRPNTDQRSVYLPAGEWYDFWKGTKFQGQSIVQYQANLDRIPVFCRAGSVIPMNVNHNYIIGTTGQEGKLTNDSSNYEVPAFLVYGKQKSYYYFQEENISLGIELEKDKMTIKNDSQQPILVIPIESPYQMKSEIGSIRSVEVSLFDRPMKAYLISGGKGEKFE